MRFDRFMEDYGYNIILGAMVIAVGFILGEIVKMAVDAVLMAFYPTEEMAELVRGNVVNTISFYTPPALITLWLIKRSVLPELRRRRRAKESGSSLRKSLPDEPRVY